MRPAKAPEMPERGTAARRPRSVRLGWRSVTEQDEGTGERIFLLGFLIYQIMCMWDTTMFPLPMAAKLGGRGLGLLLIVVKILFYSGYTPLQLIVYAILGCCTAYTLITSGYIHAFVWVVFLAGSQKVSFKKILQIYLVVSGAGMLMAGAASLLGVIENLRYISEKRGIRNSFGIIYPTDFAAHIFYMLAVFFYLKGERLRTYHYLGGLLAAALVFRFCSARLDGACILITVVLFWLGNGMEGHTYYYRDRNGVPGRRWHISDRFRRLWRRAWEGIGPFIMPFCMAAALVMTCAYGAVAASPSGILKEIDEFSTGRLRLGWQGIEDYGIHMFGREVPMIGNGGTTRMSGNYFFVDSSYISLLLRAGVLFAATVLLLFAMACRRNRNDLYFLYMIALISVNSIAAHHLVEPAYSPLLLAVFTECVREPEREPGIFEPETVPESETAFSGTKKLCVSVGPYGSGSGTGMTSGSGMGTASGMRQPAFEWKSQPRGRMARRLNERL